MTADAIASSEVIIFDCDGVLMDSNGIKEDAFAAVAERYFGTSAAGFIRKFHRENGGLSRFKKFEKLFELYSNPHQISIEGLCDEFETLAYNALLSCPLAKDLVRILNILNNQGKHLIVLSGTPETALTKLLNDRQLSQYFKAILGSPETKSSHIRRLHETGVLNSNRRFVFIGDSTVDQNAASEFSNCCFFWSYEFVDKTFEQKSSQPLASLAEFFDEAK